MTSFNGLKIQRLTCTRPSLFSRVSLLPSVLLSDARRSWTPFNHVQVVCSVSSKACCSCSVSWQLCSRSLTRLSSAWCCDCSWADTLVSLPSPRPPSFSAWPSWHKRSKESLSEGLNNLWTFLTEVLSGDFRPTRFKDRPFFEHLLLVFLHLLERCLFGATLFGFQQICGHPLFHVLQPPPEFLQAALEPTRNLQSDVCNLAAYLTPFLPYFIDDIYIVSISFLILFLLSFYCWWVWGCIWCIYISIHVL